MKKLLLVLVLLSLEMYRIGSDGAQQRQITLFLVKNQGFTTEYTDYLSDL